VGRADTGTAGPGRAGDRPPPTGPSSPENMNAENLNLKVAAMNASTDDRPPSRIVQCAPCRALRPGPRACRPCPPRPYRHRDTRTARCGVGPPTAPLHHDRPRSDSESARPGWPGPAGRQIPWAGPHVAAFRVAGRPAARPGNLKPGRTPQFAQHAGLGRVRPKWRALAIRPSKGGPGRP
jgi:hypothetical protein